MFMQREKCNPIWFVIVVRKRWRGLQKKSQKELIQNSIKWSFAAHSALHFFKSRSN